MNQSLTKDNLYSIEKTGVMSRCKCQEYIYRTSGKMNRSYAKFARSSGFLSLCNTSHEYNPSKTTFDACLCKAAHNSRQRGFTIIELMVVIVVAAVILVFAVPPFIGVINNNRITTTVNDLSASFNLARTEAIKANSIARVKPVTGNDWTQGYDIRVENGDDVTTLGDDERVRIVGQLDDAITFYTSPTSVYFNSLGGLGKTFFAGSITDFEIGIDSQNYKSSSARGFRRTLTLTSSGTGTVCVGTTVDTTPSCP